MIIFTASNATELAVIVQQPSGFTVGELPDSPRFFLPIGTYPTGFALDLSRTGQYTDSKREKTRNEEAFLWSMASDGNVVDWRIIHWGYPEYRGMIKPDAKDFTPIKEGTSTVPISARSTSSSLLTGSKPELKAEVRPEVKPAAVIPIATTAGDAEALKLIDEQVRSVTKKVRTSEPELANEVTVSQLKLKLRDFAKLTADTKSGSFSTLDKNGEELSSTLQSVSAVSKQTQVQHRIYNDITVAITERNVRSKLFSYI